ncbi:hypothetical protein ZWY2020_025855, partial [Hordeum vulgare]
MFTRNNRMDYQIFFNTRGAFRPVGWNGLVAVLCFLDIFVILWKKDYLSDTMILSMVIILATGRFLSGLKLHICNPLHRAISLWSPLVAILLTAPPLSNQVNQYTGGDDYDHDHDPSNERIGPASWIVFTALLVPVLLVTISRLRFSRIIRLADSILGSKQEIWHRIVINLCMIAALGMQVYMLHLDPFINIYAVVIIQVCPLVVESFGNFQVPAAVLCICLASLSLQHRYKNGEDQNLVASLRIFYWMVLGQGVLYAVACMLEFFSFIPRRFLVHCGGFRGYRGVESVDLYYAYALEKCMQEGVLAPKKISLSSFAIDSLNSDSPMNQLQEPSSGHYPGTVQLVSALLDTDSRLKRGNPLLDTYDEQEERDDPVLNTEDNQQAADNQMQRRNQLLALDTENLMQTQRARPNKCWQRISEFWSMPKDQLLTDHDLLPALAMSIIHSLASCDQDICVEISKADDLILKIIGFTSYRSDTMNTEAQQKILLKSSLKISKHPFLLSNLSDILGDNSSSQDSGKLVAVLRNIAIDEKTRQDIGCVQLIITRLVQAFLSAEGTTSTNADHLLRKVAGQALAMLIIESAYNCLVILKEPEFAKELKIMIHDKKYIYVAASLLRNSVLERIMNADGAELEILIGLSSQTCKVIPEDFTQQLDNDDQIKQRFLKRLVHILNANMKPSAHYPGIRRVVLEQVIHLTERNLLCRLLQRIEDNGSIIKGGTNSVKG